MLSRTTLWRLKHRSAGLAECVIRDRQDGRSSLCIIGGREPSIEVFESAYTAMRRALEIERAMTSAGWREVTLDEPRRIPSRPARRTRRGLRLVASSRSELGVF